MNRIPGLVAFLNSPDAAACSRHRVFFPRRFSHIFNFLTVRYGTAEKRKPKHIPGASGGKTKTIEPEALFRITTSQHPFIFLLSSR